ncbi:unnamed protein product [Rhizophagus irregularis]|nr:unnamed protein product [Rhizophagus irregularis]
MKLVLKSVAKISIKYDCQNSTEQTLASLSLSSSGDSSVAFNLESIKSSSTSSSLLSSSLIWTTLPLPLAFWKDAWIRYHQSHLL